MWIYTYEFEDRFCMIVAMNEIDAYERLQHVTTNAHLCRLLSVVPTLGGWVLSNTLTAF